MKQEQISNLTFRLIVLAAGSSRRYGTNKLLEPYGDTTVFEGLLHRLEQLLDEKQWQREWGALKGITVVTTHTTLQGLRAGRQLNQVTCGNRRYVGMEFVLNPNPQEGISSSIRLGLKASGRADVYGFLVADQLALRPQTILKMMAQYTRMDKGILCAKHKETLGNPVFFSQTYTKALESLTGEQGGKAVLKRHLEDVAYFEIEEALELQDLDTRQDWTHFAKENEHANFKG